MRGLALVLALGIGTVAAQDARLPPSIETLGNGEVGYHSDRSGTIMIYRFDVYRTPDSLVSVALEAQEMEIGSRSGSLSAIAPEVGGEPLVIPLRALRRLSASLERFDGMGNRPPNLELGYDENEVTFGMRRVVTWPAVWMAGGFLVLALSSVFFLIRARRDRQARIVLAEAQRAAMESREAERLRIARDLHDGPLQELHGLQLRLRSVPGAPGATAAVDIQSVVDEVRAISDDLRPPALGPFGLGAALEGIVDRAGASNPHVTFIADLEEEPARLGDAEGLMLFRIAQEAINNALEHADPSVIVVRFRSRPRPALEVTNDGQQFGGPIDLGALRRKGHFGLVGIAERVELMRGRLKLEPGPHGGTRLSVVV